MSKDSLLSLTEQKEKGISVLQGTQKASYKEKNQMD